MKTANSTLFTFVLSLLLILAPATARAVVETFDGYPTHTNTTTTAEPGADVYNIYGDWDTNSQLIGAWEGDLAGPLTSAGIVNNAQDSYAFGAADGPVPAPGQEVGIMDFGMHDWGMTSGVIADYLGADGLDLHGGTLDVRALLTGFSGQIQLGFVSDSEHDYGEGLDWVEFKGPTFTVTDSFAWYHGELNSFLSDVDDTTSYGDSAGAKVLDVWVNLFTSPAVVGGPADPGNSVSTISGELQIDEITLVPEPATLILFSAGLTLLLRRKN